MRNSAHRYSRGSSSPPARDTRPIRRSMKATPRRKSLDSPECQSIRIPLSTNEGARGAPFRKAHLNFSVAVQPASLLPRLLSGQRLDAPSRSTNGGSLDTAQNLFSTTSLLRLLHQSAVDISSIRGRQ